MSLRDIVIYGTGGLAREHHLVVNDVNAARPTWRFRGFLDDDESHHGQQLHGAEVLGGLDWLRANPDCDVVVGIGNPATRRRVVRGAAVTGSRAAILVHPRAWVGSDVRVGAGTVVTAGCLITTDICLGEHVLVNIGTTIGHDTVVDDYVTLNPGVNVSGNVRLGDGADLGTSVSVIPGVTVGAWSIVGAGSVVVHDIPPNVTAVGTPARVIKERAAGWHEL